MVKNGQTVAAFEKAFAEYVGAKYAIALCNGTATLHTALVALGVKPGDRVATTPLTMSATSIAILQAGAVPQYIDVDPQTWVINGTVPDWMIPVSLYGLHQPYGGYLLIDDAAQTLRRHGKVDFTSYSFQASKILALGEGGMLVTNKEELAEKAREFSSLGYRMKPDQPRIDSDLIRNPNYERHHSLGWNYRMNDLTASEGLKKLERGWNKYSPAEQAIHDRQEAAWGYLQAVKGCSWITPQFVPEGWTHDYWTYAIALESKELWKPFTEAIVRHGGEMPYGAWRLTYQEPAFRHLPASRTTCEGCSPAYPSHRIDRGRGWVCESHGTRLREVSTCPVAESLQPRLVQFQTNSLESAERNAKAVKKAIGELSFSRCLDGFIGRMRAAVPTAKGISWSEDINDGYSMRVATEIPRPSADATGTPCS